MNFSEFLDAVAQRRGSGEALELFSESLFKAAVRGVPPEEVLDAEFDDVVYLLSDRYQLPGWDLTVWGRGMVFADSDS